MRDKVTIGSVGGAGCVSCGHSAINVQSGGYREATRVSAIIRTAACTRGAGDLDPRVWFTKGVVKIEVEELRQKSILQWLAIIRAQCLPLSHTRHLPREKSHPWKPVLSTTLGEKSRLLCVSGWGSPKYRGHG